MAVTHVVVVGATGHLGQHLPQALRECGRTVHALVRPGTLTDPAKSGALDELVRRNVVLHPVELEGRGGRRRSAPRSTPW
jgi:uncharacterized protein YbjT (DUF2867 family)